MKGKKFILLPANSEHPLEKFTCECVKTLGDEMTDKNERKREFFLVHVRQTHKKIGGKRIFFQQQIFNQS